MSPCPSEACDRSPALLRRVRNAPEEVSVGDIITHLEHGDSDQQTVAKAALELCETDSITAAAVISELQYYLAEGDVTAVSEAAYLVGVFATEYPEDARAAIPSLIGALRDLDLIPPTVLRAISVIAKTEPVIDSDILSVIQPYLTDKPVPTCSAALTIVEAAVDVDPEQVEPIVPVLVDLVAEADTAEPTTTEVDLPGYIHGQLKKETIATEKLHQRATSVLIAIAEHDTQAVVSDLLLLRPVVLPDSNVNPYLREQVLELLWTVAEDDADAVVPFITAVTQVLTVEGERTELRTIAARILATLADTQFETVTQTTKLAIPALGTLLETDDPEPQTAAAVLLSHLAKRYPDTVCEETSRLLSLLDDDHRHVRGSAVWALAYIGTDDAKEALHDVAESDPNPELRTLTTDLLNQLPD